MLELPELDIYRALIAERFAGAQITSWEASATHADPFAELAEEELIGKVLWFVERRAQDLVFHLDSGKRLVVRMSDDTRIYCAADEQLTEQPDYALCFGERRLCLYGLRPEDMDILSVKQVEETMKGSGADPLDKKLTTSRFKARFMGSRKALKSALIDERLLSGIGEVYSDEIAFAACLSPAVKLSALGEDDWERLYEATVSVLRDAILHGGVRRRPLFASDSFSGGYEEKLRVFGRDGEACIRCGGTVGKQVVARRKSYSCSGCQQWRERG